jgi:hypothetical protein
VTVSRIATAKDGNEQNQNNQATGFHAEILAEPSEGAVPPVPTFTDRYA